jgi:tetratricopeptide (TPR) repeat protein
MKDVISHLAGKLSRGEVVFFLGAGASRDSPSNLPTSIALVRELASLVALPSRSKTKDEVVERVTSGVRFEVFLQVLAEIFGDQIIKALEILENGRSNFNHEFVARLAKHRLCPLVLTTNFDSLIEQALIREAVSFDLWYKASQYRSSLAFSGDFKVLKLHGSLCDQDGSRVYSSIIASSKQVGRPIPRTRGNVLRGVLKKYEIVFIGYSGLDDFDLLPFILATESDKSVYWVKHEEIARPILDISADLRKKDVSSLGNPERVVASRRDGVLVRGRTVQFIAALSQRMFGQSVGKIGKSLKAHDFRYLVDWAGRLAVSKYKIYINGLILQKLEDYEESIWFFEQVPRGSRFWEDSMYHRAVSHRHANHIGQARDLLRELSSGRKWSKATRVKALVQLGLLENEQTNVSLARRLLGQALRMEPRNLSIATAAHNNLGMGFLLEAERRQFSEELPNRIMSSLRMAVNHLDLTRKIVRRDGDPSVSANVNGNLGLVYTLLGEFDKAEQSLLEALRLFRSLYAFSEEASCLGNIGHFYKEKALSLAVDSTQRKESLRLALDFSREAYTLKRRVSTPPRRIALSMHELGEIYSLLGRKRVALRWLKAALKIFHREGLLRYCRDVEDTMRRIETELL